KGFQLIGSTQDTSLTDTEIKEGETYYYAISALDKNFKETKLGKVQTVRYVLSEGKPSAAAGAPEMPPRIIPEKLTVKPTRQIGFILRGKDHKPLFSPTDVTLGPDGNVYVSDTGDSMIQIFKPGGAFVRTIGGYGTKPGKFEKLLGVDVDGAGNVLAVDAYTGKIQKFDKKGRLVMYKKMLEDGKAIAVDLGLKKPVEVFGIIKGLFSPDGRLYIIDNFNDCIEIYSANGKYIKTFGGKGRQDGKLLSPTFAVFGKDGHLYVSDCLNARVQVFDKDGHFLWKFGGYGNIAGTFGRPKGICIDKEGNIYVADSMSNVVQVFDKHGRFLYALADERGKQMDLATPNGIAIDKNKRIYMVEKLVNRIQIRQVK
ncbi:MAG: NHL repeat-containing protein, partial [Nitrospirota bacterium]